MATIYANLLKHAQSLCSIKDMWKGTITHLSYLAENNETARALKLACEESFKPDASHAKWSQFLNKYIELVDAEIEKLSCQTNSSMDEVWATEQEIETLDILREHANVWAQVYAMRYPHD